jgi:hypothetical protein
VCTWESIYLFLAFITVPVCFQANKHFYLSYWAIQTSTFHKEGMSLPILYIGLLGSLCCVSFPQGGILSMLLLYSCQQHKEDVIVWLCLGGTNIQFKNHCISSFENYCNIALYDLVWVSAAVYGWLVNFALLTSVFHPRTRSRQQWPLPCEGKRAGKSIYAEVRGFKIEICSIFVHFVHKAMVDCVKSNVLYCFF